MALQSSGPISFGDLASEFGDSSPHRLGEFYKNGGLAPGLSYSNYSTGLSGYDIPNVPTSGAISPGDFYGANAITTYSESNSPLQTGIHDGYTQQNATWSPSNAIGTLGQGATFLITAGFKSGTHWQYSDRSHLTLSCTYGSAIGTTWIPQAYGKQTILALAYDGSDTITLSTRYVGNSTGSSNVGAYIKAIIRT
jgi:hypothetical protein